MPSASRSRSHVLRALLAPGLLLLASPVAGCAGCNVSFERSPTGATGLFRGLVVGGTKPDGLFVVAQRENAPDDLEATVVSLGEETRTCSLGRAASYGTVWQRMVIDPEDSAVDERPGRILAVEGELGDTNGTLRVFNVSCEVVLQAPAVELPVMPVFGADGWPEAWTARTVDGSLLWIDPWAPSIRTLGEQVSAYGRLRSKGFWLVEDGTLVIRDAEGNKLASAGAGVTEVAISPDETELAFVDESGLSTMSLERFTLAPIPTDGAPCKPMFLWLSSMTLAYREDCALGSLALLDRWTGEKQALSSDVTEVSWSWGKGGYWVFFLREPPGGDPELWAMPERKEPVLVGLDPDPVLYKITFDEERFFVILDHDGDTGTLGGWTQDEGFDPLLEGVGRTLRLDRYLVAVAEREGEVGTLVALDRESFDSALRVGGVPWTKVWPASQAPVLGYIRGWSAAIGAGTLEVWVPQTDQQVVVDEGVSEYRELFWPEPGVVYSVRTLGREGLWTAYADL